MAKVLISIDDALLKRADKAAASRKMTRSGFIAQLVTKELDGEVGPGASAQAQAALDRLDDLFSSNSTPGGDSTRIIREMRDAR